MAAQMPAGGKTSSKGLLGCALVFVLAFAGCTAYVVASGNSDNTAASSTSSQRDAPPTAAATSASASPAQMLADLDGGVNPVSDYQSALDALAPKCTQDEYNIAALAYVTYNDLVKNGIADETRLSVLQHLNQSIPDSLGKTDCGQMLAAYATLREG